jgi:4-hydroxybenzoate polyprenyltransferase
VVDLLKASHPEPTIAVTAMTTAFAAAAGRGPAGVFWVAAAVLAGQLSVGWNNDYLDRDRDAAARRWDKPIVTGAVAAETVRRAAVLALVAAAAASFASGWRAAVAHLAALAVAWGYNAGAKSTAVSVLPYVVAFGAAPAFVILGLPGHPLPPAWLVAAAGLLGGGAHFVNVLPDMADDLRAGVRGLPHRLGRRRSIVVAAVLLLAASWLLAAAPPGGLDGLGLAALATVAALVSVALWTSRRPGSRAAFRVVLLVAVLDVALLVARGAVSGRQEAATATSCCAASWNNPTNNSTNSRTDVTLNTGRASESGSTPDTGDMPTCADTTAAAIAV